MGAAIGTGARAIGSVVEKVVGDNLDPSDDRFKLDQQTLKERVNDIRQITELKLEKFSDEIVLKASGTSGNSATVPICSIVSNEESLFAATGEEITKNLPHTVQRIVNDALKSKWRETIADLITGGLDSFFGPAQRAASGISSDTKEYFVVWASNAMLRLDVYVTKTHLCQLAGFNESKEIFGGFVMVVSVVDIAKIHWQVLLYEFSKFYEKVQEHDKDACETLLRSIRDTQRLLDATGVLFHEAQSLSHDRYHPEEITAKPLEKIADAFTNNGTANTSSST